MVRIQSESQRADLVLLEQILRQRSLAVAKHRQVYVWVLYTVCFVAVVVSLLLFLRPSILWALLLAILLCSIFAFFLNGSYKKHIEDGDDFVHRNNRVLSRFAVAFDPHSLRLIEVPVYNPATGHGRYQHR